jgi:hypothetical protein
MSKAVYNSAILDVALNSLRLALRISGGFRKFLPLSAITISFMTASAATDWNTPEQNLAEKIAVVTGPAAISATFENRSSLSKRDSAIVENGLRSTMEALGLRFVAAGQSSTRIVVSFSENRTSYVWIAQIHPNSGDPVVTMVSFPRPDGSVATDSVPLSLRKIPLFAQDQPILDVAVLEETSTVTRVAVLDSESLSFYRMQNGTWQSGPSLAIPHAQPWPRDLRGRLIAARDGSLNIELPGVHCTTKAASAETLDCRQSDDPWRLLPGDWQGKPAFSPSAGIADGGSKVVSQTNAFFAPTRNFFTGVLVPAIGKFATVPKFFSAAIVPNQSSILWLFAGTDGRVHIVDGVSDQIGSFSWGSDIASVRTACGAGWQVLATSAGEQINDSIRAYEFPEHDPVAVTRDVELDGKLTVLWTESRGDTAVVVDRNRDTGTYEAFRLAMACDQ